MAEIKERRAAGVSRRDILKKGAVAGGVVWATPLVLSTPAYAAGSLADDLCPSKSSTITQLSFRWMAGADCSVWEPCITPGLPAQQGRCDGAAIILPSRPTPMSTTGSAAQESDELEPVEPESTETSVELESTETPVELESTKDLEALTGSEGPEGDRKLEELDASVEDEELFVAPADTAQTGPVLITAKAWEWNGGIQHFDRGRAVSIDPLESNPLPMYAGDTFTFTVNLRGTAGNNVRVEVSDGTRSQSVRLHISCSQSLCVGDQYGAFMIVEPSTSTGRR